MMDENDTPVPWSPGGAALKKYLPAADDLHLVGIEGLLDISASPFKTPGGDFGSPFRPRTSRLKVAPHSPGTTLILEAAKATETGRSPFATRRLGNYFDSPETSLYESGPIDFVSPPSPARTPSRFLSPRTDNRLRRDPLVSPAFIGSTPHDRTLSEKQTEDLVGSIWKHSEDEKRLNTTAHARRPLELQQAFSFADDDDSQDETFLMPLPARSPAAQTPPPSRRLVQTPKVQNTTGARKQSAEKRKAEKTASEKRKDKKDRKTYSTTNRPRVRGEYKCGKCGFYPKKEKHDCLKEIARKSREGGHAAAVTPSPLRKGTPVRGPR
mmetsp:Transcript_34396/g.103704  ORF Transcript_34396/g.103704 Transcript_34396/m.103704 type:complete len:325 (-) Transcript_34396:219-1193(-)